VKLIPAKGQDPGDLSDLRVYYRHTHCLGCDEAWIIEKWTTNFERRRRDNALVETWSAWRPISQVPLPFQDCAAALKEERYQRHDISELRVTTIHTGDYIMAFLLQ
jgi:hypothetical protein